MSSEQHRLTEIYQRLLPMLAKLLRIPVTQFVLETPLTEYGISSVVFLVLMQKINKNFTCALKIEDFAFNHSLISLAELILKKSDFPHVLEA